MKVTDDIKKSLYEEMMQKKSIYSALGMANTYGKTNDELMKLENSYRRAENEYFQALADYNCVC